MEASYGPFRNLPIIFLDAEFDAFLAELVQNEKPLNGDKRTVSQDELKADFSPRAVSQRILQVWHSDNSLTFSKLKEIIAPNQSFRAFRFAWGLAVLDQPRLSDRGRRKKT